MTKTTTWEIRSRGKDDPNKTWWDIYRALPSLEQAKEILSYQENENRELKIVRVEKTIEEFEEIV